MEGSSFDIREHRRAFNSTLDFISGMQYTFSKRIEYRKSYTTSEGYSFTKKNFYHLYGN